LANYLLASLVFLLALWGPHESPRPTTLKAASFVEAARVPFELEVPVAREQAFQPLLKSQKPLSQLLGNFTITRQKKNLLLESESLARPLKVRGAASQWYWSCHLTAVSCQCCFTANKVSGLRRQQPC
jgi:hypothetical protein